MGLTAFLPERLRVGLRALQRNVSDARAVASPTWRPVFTRLHTQEEIDAMTRRAAAERAERLAVASTESGGLRAEFRDLEIVEVERTTSDSVTIRLRNPESNPVRFQPGQYLTVVWTVGGEELRRAYSICSDPLDRETLSITVRRVPGGRVSNALNDAAAPGVVLRTLGPSGRFVPSEPGMRRRRAVLVAGGAGITPLLSIARVLSRLEPESTIELVYANRDPSRVVLGDAVDALAATRPNVRVTHVMERPGRRRGVRKGQLAGEVLAAAVPLDAEAEYFVCGPEAMMEGVTSWLAASGVPSERVRLERFSASLRSARAEPRGETHGVRFARSGRMVQVRDDETLLDAGRRAGIALPFSCGMGGCGACRQHVREGEVAMDEPNCLTPDEREQGWVLTCVGRPRTSLVVDA